MYYRWGPPLLCIISVLVLGLFLTLAEDIEMGGTLFLILACVGCPLLSRIIYTSIKRKQAEDEIHRQLEDYYRKKYPHSPIYNKTDDAEDEESKWNRISKILLAILGILIGSLILFFTFTFL